MIFDPGSTLNGGVSRSNPKPCSKYFGSFDPFSPENVAKLEAPTPEDVGVSENRSTLFGGPYNKDPTI